MIFGQDEKEWINYMSHSEITTILTTTRLSQYLDSHELHVLTSYGKTVKFSAGNCIVKQGKIAKGIYIILDGTAVLTAKVLGEGFTKFASLGHGNFIGEVSMVDKKPSTISVIATSEMTCLFFSRDYLDTLALLHREICYQLKRAISDAIIENLGNFNQKIIKIMQQTHMETRSIFISLIESLHQPVLLNHTEAEIYIEQLPDLDFFHAFNPEEKTELFQHFELIKAPTECTLIEDGDVDSTFYIVLYGAVQSTIIHNNKVAKLSVLGPLEVFSSISIMDNTSPSIFNYMTCEQAVLLRMNQQHIELLQKNNMHVWYKVFDLICQSFATLARSAEKLDIRLNSELYNR